MAHNNNIGFSNTHIGFILNCIKSSVTLFTRASGINVQINYTLACIRPTSIKEHKVSAGIDK